MRSEIPNKEVLKRRKAMERVIKYPELEGQIAARGIRKTAIARRIGCSERSLYSKLSGKTQFTWDEVVAIKTTFFPDVEPVELMRTDRV
jgi:hypothetical protein